MAHMLWELAKNPEYQIKLREELDNFVSAKGNANFTATELESMPYLNAVIKVGCSPTGELGSFTKIRSRRRCVYTLLCRI